MQSLSLFDIALRATAAIFGGYALAACFSVALAEWLPFDRTDAVLTASLMSFSVHIAVFLWAFAASSAARAWRGVTLTGIAFVALAGFGAAI